MWSAYTCFFAQKKVKITLPVPNFQPLILIRKCFSLVEEAHFLETNRYFQYWIKNISFCVNIHEFSSKNSNFSMQPASYPTLLRGSFFSVHKLSICTVFASTWYCWINQYYCVIDWNISFCLRTNLLKSEYFCLLQKKNLFIKWNHVDFDNLDANAIKNKLK